MADIVIPGFSVKFTNDTYLRETSINGKTPVTQIVQLYRYHVPIQEELLELIRTEAKKSTRKKKVSPLAKYIAKTIPNLDERRRIAQNEEVIMEIIKQSIPYSYHDEGRDYLMISHGIVPDKDIAELDEEDIFPEAFSWLIEEKGYNEWYSSIRLEDGLFLPADLDVQFAFENRIFNSSFLKINCKGNPYLYPEIEKLSRRVYMALRLGNVYELEDMSEWFGEKIARKTIRIYDQEKDVYQIFEDKGDDGKGESYGINKHNFNYTRPFSEN